MKKLLSILLAMMMLFSFAFADEILVEDGIATNGDLLVEYGYEYSEPEEVALYLHAFDELPPNFITKYEARDMGWNSKEGNLWEVAYGYSIGGDEFGNREGLLPKAKNRQWYECDVNYEGDYRGSERIVFSNDGLIYYTDDHYESFELLYDDWYYSDGWYSEEESEDRYEASYESGYEPSYEDEYGYEEEYDYSDVLGSILDYLW